MPEILILAELNKYMVKNDTELQKKVEMAALKIEEWVVWE